jgi:transketolase
VALEPASEPLVPLVAPPDGVAAPVVWFPPDPPQPARAVAAMAIAIAARLIHIRLCVQVPSGRLSRVPGGAARCYPRRPVLTESHPKAVPFDQAHDEPSMAHLKPVPDLKPEPSGKTGGKPGVAALERYATVLRIHCVRMVAVAKAGHLDSSLSAADIVAALYYRVLRHDPSNPKWPERDRFVLSKGHGAPIQYAALAEHGYFPADDLMGLRQIGSHLQGHPDMTRTPGIEVSTGSLGQGLSMSVGICLALRLDDLDDTAQVFTLMSDGDIQEGESWEGAMSAAHFGLTNLTAIVDYNHLQTDGTTEEVMDTGDVRAKFEAFGWDAVEIDGHDMGAIVESLERSRTLDRPAAIVCQTKKGRGVSFMEDRFGFHGKPPSQEQAEQAMEELEATYQAQTKALEAKS